MMKSVLALVVALLLIMTGCEKKLEPVPVGEMTAYKDPAYGFHIEYPKEWKQLGTAGKAIFTRSQEVANKFLDPTAGEEGAQVIIEVVQFGGKSAAELMAARKEETKQYAQLGTDEKVTVGGKEATRVPYTIKVTSKTNISGYEIFVPGDTALYVLEFAGYGDQFTAHAAVFDAMLKTFQLPVIVAKVPGVWQASANAETYDSKFFTMKYPDNLNFVSVPKGDKDLVMEMRADRQDCSIHIDVFGAKGLTVDKVWEQNKGRYKARGTGETTIGGEKSFWVDYAPAAGINSRAYFTVKSDKVIRVTVNYFAQQKDAYFTAFESCVKSITLK
jgi:hypothetical protein